MTKDLPIPKLESVPAFYKGIHKYSFRSGERAEIIGVRVVNFRYKPVPCYVLLYYDGMIDYSPINDTLNYVIEGPH